ncbi:MAG: hypothetical protein LBG12_00420 [Synergistaceae bacterium]|nr:hypothetical protein [Synergistaceae bacterium]
MDEKIVKGVIALLHWLEKNYKAAVGGLVIVILLLAAAFASSRSTASKEIAGLNETKASLEATVESREKELEETRALAAELEKSDEQAKSEIAALTESNGKLEERIASLSGELTSADNRIVSLQDSVVIRRKAMANMRADIAALKGETREYVKELNEARARAAELEKSGEQAKSEIAALTESNGKLEERIVSLQDSVAIRRKAMANMRADIAALKGEAREYLEELEELRGRLEEIERITSPRVENAFPASSEALGTVILKLSGLEPLGTIASGLKETVPAIFDGDGDEEIEEFVSSLEVYEDFFGSVGDVAVLLEMSRRPELYVSFLADAATFHEFISRDSGLYSFDPWYEQGVGYYTLRPVEEDVMFYVAERPAGLAEASSLVFMSTTETGIARMTDAYDGVSTRFEMERHTSGENFFQVKLKDGLTFRDIGLSMWSIPGLANLWNSTPDKVFWSVIEESWTREGDDIVGETYSDMFERNPEILPPRPENALKRDIYGNGSLAYYVSADFGLLLNMILPGATRLTPEILAFVDTYATFPFVSKKDFTNLLRGGWFSLVCVEKGGRISTAYAALETNVPEAAGALYELAELLFISISRGGRVGIRGWDSAMSAPIPLPWEDSQSALSLVIAKNNERGTFLVGLGNTADFGTAVGPGTEDGSGKTVDIPAEAIDYVNTENIGEFFISPKIFDVAINYVNEFANPRKPYISQEDIKVKDMVVDGMAEFRDSFHFLGGGVRPSGRGYVNLSMAEGKNPTKLLLVPMMMLATENATDSAEATKIINDLRNLKSAALLYYGDNLEWPAQEDVLELDEYLDRPLVSGGRYERVIIGDEYVDGSGNKRVNIGVELRPGGNGATAVRKKLASKAEDSGLFGNADSLDYYSGSSLEVYMNMR